MGWDYTRDQTRKRLIAKRIQDWENERVKAHCLAHCAVGNVLWTVWEHTYVDHTDRFIGCDLMQDDRGYGWGYKAMAEEMHPYYFSCPLKYLEMVPVACEEWREGVRHYHRKVELGATYKLLNSIIPQVVITSVKPLRGFYLGTTYRVKKQMLGDKVI